MSQPASPASRRRFLTLALACPACAVAARVGIAAEHAAPKGGHDAPHWSYEGPTGPAQWGKLAPGDALCGIGREQSPVNLTEAIPAATPDLATRWAPATAEIIHNGHTIQVNWPAGSEAVIDRQPHQLLQFHFHHPSEHVIDGRSFPLEVHFVHRNASGGLAVVGLFFTPGPANPTLEAIWSAMPTQAGDKTRLAAPLDIASFLPGDPTSYRYAGSLTTPPCSEVVSWVVLRQPVSASPAQIERFAALFPMNARPVQPLNRRKLLLDLL
ncbi:carbonic anhydrase [Parapedomonas caeni]|jgi:carbonic anhydrase